VNNVRTVTITMTNTNALTLGQPRGDR
jgi:hypothetical protein